MENILSAIRAKGGRITKVRREIIKILCETDCLSSQAAILTKLERAGLDPDRSTIFRELQFLSQNNIIVKNNISGTVYYEIPDEHHHHLICLQCHSIKKVELGNHLEEKEKQLAKKNRFTITNHSLEFYGYCQHCHIKTA